MLDQIKLYKQAITSFMDTFDDSPPGRNNSMRAINVLIIALFLQFCETSTQTNCQLRKRNCSKSSEDATKQIEASSVQEEKESIVSPSGYLDWIFSNLIEQEQEFKTPGDDSFPVKLATRTISGYEAIILAPALTQNKDMLATNLRRIKTIETLMAAAKMKSFITNNNLIKLDEQPITYSNIFEFEENERFVPDSNNLMADSIANLIKKLPKQVQTDTLNQINNLDFDRISLDQFVNEKKSQISDILAECAVEICKFKVLLHSTSSVLSAQLTAGWLHLIVDRLAVLNWSSKRVRELKAAEFNSFFKQKTNINFHRDRIGRILENLAIILEKL